MNINIITIINNDLYLCYFIILLFILFYYLLLIGYLYETCFVTYKFPISLFIFGVILYFFLLFLPSYLGIPINLAYAGFFLYQFLYTWKEIPKSFTSLCLFFGNYLIFLSFLVGLYYLNIKGLPLPIYFENLTKFSFYRYTIYLSIIFIACFIYLIIYFFKVNFSIPFSLKEEGNKLVDAFGPSVFYPFFSKIIKFFSKPSKLRFLVTCLHFSFFYILRLVSVLLFFNFSFFHGDLRYVLYLFPFLFIVWILSFIDYSFKNSINVNLEYCKKILIVIPKQPITTTKPFLATYSDFIYKITPFGIEEGFTNRPSIDATIVGFFELSEVNYCLKKYQEVVLIITTIIITFRIICWLYLVNFFLFYHSEFVETTWTSVFSRISLRNISQRNYATAAYYIKPIHQPALEKETEGAYKSGHMVALDKDITNENDHYLFEGCITHGPGTPQNPSFKVSKTHDLSGPHPKGQSLVSPKTPTYVDPADVAKEVPNSTSFFKRYDVKENIAKNTYKDWGDKNT